MNDDINHEQNSTNSLQVRNIIRQDNRRSTTKPPPSSKLGRQHSHRSAVLSGSSSCHKSRSLVISHLLARRTFTFESVNARLNLNVKEIDPAARKIREKPLNLDEESPFAFIMNLFILQGSSLREILPQILLVWILELASSVIYMEMGDPTNLLPPDAITTYKLLGVALTYLIYFRVNKTQASYKESTVLVNTMVNCLLHVVQKTSSHIHIEESGEAKDQKIMLSYLHQICRLTNLQFAVIRQLLREQKSGFDPDSGLNLEKSVPISRYSCCPPERNFSENFKEHWVSDPAVPLISTLINEYEFIKLDELEPSIRPAMVQKSLLMACHEFAALLSEESAGFYIESVTRDIEGCISACKSSLLIIETPLPVPLRHFLYILTFSFVYITPFVFVVGGDEWEFQAGWIVSTTICACYYGLIELTAKLQDPFGWDAVDLDIDKFGMQLMKETLMISNVDAVEWGNPNHTDRWLPRRSLLNVIPSL